MANSTFSGPVRSQNGFETVSINSTTGAVTVTSTLGTSTSVTNLTATNLVFTDQNHPTTAAINATATATAAEVATGYITTTSAAAVTITLPTGTDLGAALGATKGTVLDLYIDNTASTVSGVVTVAVATNGILSAAAAAGSGAGAGLLTVPIGVTGVGCFRIMFSSPTAYVFSRIA
jgi:hypothetical protein